MNAVVIVMPTSDLDSPSEISVEAGATIQQIISAYGNRLGITSKHVATINGAVVRDYNTVLQADTELTFRVGSKERG